LAGFDAIAVVMVSISLFGANTFNSLSQLDLNTETALLIAILLFVTRSIAAVFVNFIILKRIAAEQVRLGQMNFEWIARKPWVERKKMSQGDSYITIEYAPQDLFQKFLIPGIEVFSEIFSVIAIVSVLAIAQPITAAVAISYFGGIAIFQNIVLSKRIQKAGKIQADSITGVADLVGEIHNLAKLTKILKSQTLDKELKHRREKRINASRQVSFLEQLPRNLMEVTLVSGVAVIALSTLVFAGQDEVVGSLTLFAAAAFRLLPSFNRIQANGLTLLASSPMASKSLLGSHNLEQPIGSAKTSEVTAPELTRGFNSTAGSDVKLTNVSFTYPNSKSPVLQDITFELHAGRQYAIIGESGSGKTTLADLLLGLMTPSSGAIQVSNHDQNLVLGYVPQTTYIFRGSIAQNIALEWDDNAIDFNKVAIAVKQSALEKIFDNNLSSPLSEHRLSGGQMQRIGIARALYRRPSLLILDESTNSLDVNTENEIISSLDQINGQVTTILIAHSMRTIQNVDKILHLEAGRLANFDSFQNLMSNSKNFRELVNSGKLFNSDD
jgi:ATP-binding cassette, subfamily B, bacterial PglK